MVKSATLTLDRNGASNGTLFSKSNSLAALHIRASGQFCRERSMRGCSCSGGKALRSPEKFSQRGAYCVSFRWTPNP
jgi:hypothetical protein